MVVSTGHWYRLTNNNPLDCPSLHPVHRVARATPKAGFWFSAQKQPVLEAGGASLVKKPHLDTKTSGHQGERKSAGGAFTSTTDSRKNGSQRGWHS